MRTFEGFSFFLIFIRGSLVIFRAISFPFCRLFLVHTPVQLLFKSYSPFIPEHLLYIVIIVYTVHSLIEACRFSLFNNHRWFLQNVRSLDVDMKVDDIVKKSSRGSNLSSKIGISRLGRWHEDGTLNTYTPFGRFVLG